MDPIPRETKEQCAEPCNTAPEKKKARKSKPAAKKKKIRFDWKWTACIFLSSLSVSAVLSLLSNEITGNMGIILSFAILLLFIYIGVIFDIIGLAIATADVKPFHSMAARKLDAGRKAVTLINNADRASSICNDVVGDISGVVSGSTAAAIAVKLTVNNSSDFWISLLLCASVSALIVGLKSLGKTLSLSYSHEIVYTVSKILSFFSHGKKHKVKK